MKLSEIKNRKEFIDYLTCRQLEGKKAEDDAQEKILKMCEEFDIPKSMLRMHQDVKKK